MASSLDLSAGAPSQQRQYALWLQLVGNKTAALIAQWHRVGFTHGVLNTDNLSLLGETIGKSCGVW